MKEKLRVGIIGCGNISAVYFANRGLFKTFSVVACADAVPAAAEARAKEFAVEALSVEKLLARDDIDIVVNLTVPASHYEVSRAALEAGKHVYTEKPLATSPAEGKKLLELAAERGLLVGAAPDTFLGGAHQLSRALIDEGRIGRILGGSCVLMGHGMEHWHPNPSFFFKKGAGPILDMGPYYIAALVNLVGPVRRVSALASIGFKERVVASEARKGERISVETPTTVHASLEFENGALFSLSMSWDVWKHGHPNRIELYGTEGSMIVSDPNFFGGSVSVSVKDGDWTDIQSDGLELSTPNYPFAGPFKNANYRGAGLADMALAAAGTGKHRCDGELALHCLETLSAILESCESGASIAIESRPPRPAPLTADDAKAFLA